MDEPLTLTNLAGGEAERRFQEALATIDEHLRRRDLADVRRGKAVITLKVVVDADIENQHATVVLDTCEVTSLPAVKKAGRIARMKGGMFHVDPVEIDADGTRPLPFPNKPAKE